MQERTYGSDPTPTIVSPIPTLAKLEPLVPLEVGVVGSRSRPDPSGVVQSRPAP